ncbi:hypothetical protein QBC43DRAFT_71352 [Cladorrhinum sp. PSN259]|nr:hypothetical protein QBC43DRAFT_71352 [Cladorrhinum sp. PSN259]
MSEQQDDIDHQLAESVERELEEEIGTIFRNKTLAQLEKVCSDHETRLRQAFQEQVEAFNKQKQTIITTMSKVSAKRGTPNAVQPRLFQHLEPESFQFLRRHFDLDRRQTSPTVGALSPATSTSSSMQFSDSGSGKATSLLTDNNASRKVHTAKRSGAQPVFGASSKRPKLTVPTQTTADVAGQQPTPSSVPPSPSATMKKEYLATAAESTGTTSPGTRAMKNKDLLSTEVEGIDFMFKYPDYGPGWFVIRCPSKDDTKSPVSFKEHPLSAFGPSKPSLALRHFNNDDGTCYGHSAYKKKPYSSAEIMELFGHRVRGVHGARVDEGWVTSSNEMLKSDGSKEKVVGKEHANTILSWAP